jgi:hypothetical protein
MAFQHHKLSDVAADHVDALAAEGIVCTPAEVVLLNALAWEIETPRHRIEMSRGVPIFAGRVAIWPLTLAAEAWWSAAIKLHTGETAEMQILAYAMAHARTPDALDAVSPAAAAKVAAKWAKGLHVRPKELSIIVGEVLAQDEDLPRLKGPKDGSKGLSAGQIVAILTATVGGTPRMWETEVAIGYIREQMRAVAAQQAAENGGSLKDSDMVAATRQMGLYVEQIRARARGENGDN